MQAPQGKSGTKEKKKTSKLLRGACKKPASEVGGIKDCLFKTVKTSPGQHAKMRQKSQPGRSRKIEINSLWVNGGLEEGRGEPRKAMKLRKRKASNSGAE